ncbi:MAG: glycosyltransferase family 2 protein [Candidatus Saccharibacteria bacterium]|nr:glycosyltransferase family 2 protein [Candidatus Saccharibacteria bacterium]
MGKLISIVVPVYNEEDGILEFLDNELFSVLKSLNYDVEVIIVDDGSTDKTIEKIKSTKILNDFLVNIIALTRNFGKEVALTVGLEAANGNAVIMVDADGQHPVEEIPKMLQKWEDGAVIVTAVNTGNTTKHKIRSKIYYKIMQMMGNKNVMPGAMDFRLLDRIVVDEFNQLTERNRLTRGLIDWLGFPQEYIKVKTKGREKGRPTYSTKKLAGLALDSVVSSSRTPLVFFGHLGIFITIFSLFFGLFILIEQYIMGDPLNLDWSGAVAMSVFISFLVGLVLISQSITALYISQIHAEAKGRPLYVIDKKKSFVSKNVKR